jgi:hypothetical protein
MRTFLFISLFFSSESYSQIDSLQFYQQQIEQDSIQLIKSQFRIDSLKLELEALKSESKDTQFFIDALKEENRWLNELMKKYQNQLKQKQEVILKEEEK